MKLKFGDLYDTLPKCKICGWRSTTLQNHIRQIHKMKLDDYKFKYNCKKSDIHHESYLNYLSNRCIGDKNPGYEHGGKLSPNSKNFIKYKDLTEKETNKRLKLHGNKISNSKMENPENNALRVEYWTSRGYSQQEAKLKLKKRQSTNSKENFIKKYGKIEGIAKWKERQIKWQNTLNSKSDEEKERINKLKVPVLNNNTGFSKISQELFWLIYDHIKDKYKDIYFATLDQKTKNRSITNNEYVVVVDNIYHRLLDFYIPEVNKCVEFDGDFWHKHREVDDHHREEQIKIALPNIEMYRVKEKYYRENPDNVINECLEFING